MGGLDIEMKEQFSGKFIVLDGPDGSGKSTQIKLLAKFFEQNGLMVEVTRDPGGTEIGEQIRRLLLFDAKGKMDVNTEVMLFMASRAQLVKEIVKPAIEAGKVVLCDRFISATCAYQGAGGYSVEKIINFGHYAVGDVWPDLTIILDIPAEEGRARTGHKKGQRTKEKHKDANQGFLFEATPNRFDSKTLEYHRKVRNGFLHLPAIYPRPVVIVECAKKSIEAVHKSIIDAVSNTDF